MRIPLLLVLFFAGFQSFAQRLENIRAEAVNGGEQVTITYDITGASSDQKFKVTVYGSHNNYSTPLTLVTGDVNEVRAGTNKKITWDAKGEMVEYKGDITFELRADPILATLAVKTPSGVKKGKGTTIKYEGVAPGENVKLELIKGGVVVNQIGSTTDPSSYHWNVPVDVEKASGYQVRLTAGTRTTTSGSFAIKQKIKTWMYVVPAAVVVGAVVFIVAKPKSGSGAKDLPEPPDPEN
jgi:hypothetical protein